MLFNNVVEPIIQPYAIDVTMWQPDEEFSNYPEGARPKLALFPPDDIELSFIDKSRRYMLKRSQRRYPDQFWGEIIAYQIGCLLGINVPPAYAAFDTEKKYCGALIEWFYYDNSGQLFVTGGNILQAVKPDYDRKYGCQHNYDLVNKVCELLSKRLAVPWRYFWGEVFLFDALIGNTDRHQDNWGFLFEVNTDKIRFAPIFDNGTSLGHEMFAKNVSTWQEDDFIRYVSKGRHHMKWKINDPAGFEQQPKGCEHLEIIKKLAYDDPPLIEHLLHITNNFSIDQLGNILRVLKTLELPTRLTHERSDFILKLVKLRHKRLLNILVELRE